MRIAIVGPTHPIKGGIAQHTTWLATHLSDAGHDVRIISWRRQYPRRLYPGVQTVSVPEIPPFGRVEYRLCWDRPGTWIRAARGIRDVDLVVFAHVTPVQVLPYLAMLAALTGSTARTVTICHNVLPHERSLVDRLLVGWLLQATGRVVVHSRQEAELAERLTTKPIEWVRMPPFMPSAFVPSVPAPGVHGRVLFFGLVRPYKGLDVLLRALATGPPKVQLRIAGEVWGGTRQIDELCRTLGISDRVELRPDYVPASDVPHLFADVDALVLPYRSATGSQAVWTAFQFGVPVIASKVGALADDVTPGVDGLVVEPGDVDGLAQALHQFYEAGEPEGMRSKVKPVDPAPYWEGYISALLDPGPAAPASGPPGGPVIHMAKRGAEQVLWGRVALRHLLSARSQRPRPLPPPLPSTDILDRAADYQNAIRECRRLRLPLHHDRPKNWDSLGAVSAVLHHCGVGARVLDAGAARYSPVLPWLRVYGLSQLFGINLEFTRSFHHGPVRFDPGDITSTRYPDGWFDAVTCMSVIEHGVPWDPFLKEAARILRPGGLLVVSTDYDQDPPNTEGLEAYGAPVHIYGPEDIRRFVEAAAGAGMELVGDLRLAHRERPVHWKRTGLDYTFIRMTFLRT